MVAVIKAGKSLKTTLHYNENKVKAGVAELIHSSGFAKDTEELGFKDKLLRLQKLAALNERTKINSVHISLNFDPSEKLHTSILKEIADAYMAKIGFGDQPYLVYQHHDAGHPHIHVVTTNIRTDGSRIKLHNIGRNQSEKARKEIEKEFKLVEAQSKQVKQVYELKPINPQKVTYGRSETKRAITNVLNAILPTYRYASLPELNAILKGYNLVADQGDKNSRTYSHGGLVYRVLDEKGQKIGVPVKASDIYNKPTFKFLKQRFLQNETLKEPHKVRVKNSINLYFLKHSHPSLPDLTSALQKERIQVVLRQNDKGIIYGMTYVDHQTKCVFNGSDLGKQYSSNAIQQRCSPKASAALRNQVNESQELRQELAHKDDHPNGTHSYSKNLLEDLMKPENTGSIPDELKEEENKKKKRKRLHL